MRQLVAAVVLAALGGVIATHATSRAAEDAPPPLAVSAQPLGPDRILVRWIPGERKPDEWLVERHAGPPTFFPRFDVVARVPGADTQFEDTSCKADEVYDYRVSGLLGQDQSVRVGASARALPSFDLQLRRGLLRPPDTGRNRRNNVLLDMDVPLARRFDPANRRVVVEAGPPGEGFVLSIDASTTEWKRSGITYRWRRRQSQEVFDLRFDPRRGRAVLRGRGVQIPAFAVRPSVAFRVSEEVGRTLPLWEHTGETFRVR